MNIYSSIYPELLLALPSGAVQFVDGSATVTDETLAGEVLELAARAGDLGLIVPEATPTEDEKPKKQGKKSDKDDEGLV